jgi:hypothetical protein
MKKVLFTLLLFVTLTGVFTSCVNDSKPSDSNTTETVYVCNSETSYAYHKSSNCRGLSNCTHEVIKVTVTEAKRKNKRPCKICY